MSGNLWMFSDKLDDEDIEIMKHEFITYYQGADYYGLGLKMFTRLAHEAGAVYKIGKPDWFPHCRQKGYHQVWLS